MKHFKTISIIFIVGIAAIFGGNIYCLYCLYRSIRINVERDVMTALIDTDIDDMWERADRRRKAYMTELKQARERGDSTVIEQETKTISGNMNADGTIGTTIVSNQGYESDVQTTSVDRQKSFANQMAAEMSQQMHHQMDNMYEFNLAITDSILLERLADRRIHTDFAAVEIVDSLGNILHGNSHIPDTGNLDVFSLCFNSYQGYYYRAYLTPLTRHILSEMAGVIVTVFLLMISFALAFWYLLHTVSKLRTIEEMKDDFVSNMTHELKTPIAIAYSANDALLNYDTANDPTKKETYLKIANRQLNRLSELVEKILSMSMERRKTMKIKQETVQLRPLIEDIAAAQRMRSEKEIRIEIDIDERISVITDKEHLSNVINNLIDNAIKYSGDSVDIKIKSTPDEISVSDNGIGIPQKSIPYLFNKFYRVPHGNRQDVRGYGIGLYYVKSILDKMGWT
ncbi:MAG: HAMP domain-containing histidine kinase, partial [Muribaculaceae bacterium]|nr:HAMP domain-containing histidine kinase [Muribaculaceae bacterium]